MHAHRFLAAVAALFLGGWVGAAATTSSTGATDGATLYNQLPACAKPCHRAASKAVGCGARDLECLCEKQAAYSKKARGCVVGACGISESLRTKSLAAGACAQGHVEL